MSEIENDWVRLRFDSPSYGSGIFPTTVFSFCHAGYSHPIRVPGRCLPLLIYTCGGAKSMNCAATEIIPAVHLSDSSLPL
jgi:hypothetical protein